MSLTPTQRRDQILSWLKEDQLLKIDELTERLDVSNMTIHRDLDILVEMELVEKVHGAVRLPDPYHMTTATCHVCHMPVKTRLDFVIRTTDDQSLRACCPHCGLLLLETTENVLSALVKDFLYGKIINVRQAYFVIESRISVCCEPSILTFANEQDAKDFSHGFGGQVMNFSTALEYTIQTHR